MKQPVSLEHYFFPVVKVVANPTWDSKSGGEARPHVEISVSCSEIEEMRNTFQVQLTILIKNTIEHPSQYEVELVAYGVLSAHPELHDKENNMRVTGSSILYSASREFLLGIMSRGPWPPIMLHAMPFNISRPEESKQKSEPDEKAKAHIPKSRAKKI